MRSVALGTLSPTFAIICSFNCRPTGGLTNRRTLGEGVQFVESAARPA
jgi:hypothetical protein